MEHVDGLSTGITSLYCTARLSNHCTVASVSPFLLLERPLNIHYDDPTFDLRPLQLDYFHCLSHLTYSYLVSSVECLYLLDEAKEFVRSVSIVYLKVTSLKTG